MGNWNSSFVSFMASCQCSKHIFDINDWKIRSLFNRRFFLMVDLVVTLATYLFRLRDWLCRWIEELMIVLDGSTSLLATLRGFSTRSFLYRPTSRLFHRDESDHSSEDSETYMLLQWVTLVDHLMSLEECPSLRDGFWHKEPHVGRHLSWHFYWKTKTYRNCSISSHHSDSLWQKGQRISVLWNDTDHCEGHTCSNCQP